MSHLYSIISLDIAEHNSPSTPTSTKTCVALTKLVEKQEDCYVDILHLL